MCVFDTGLQEHAAMQNYESIHQCSIHQYAICACFYMKLYPQYFRSQKQNVFAVCMSGQISIYVCGVRVYIYIYIYMHTHIYTASDLAPVEAPIEGNGSLALSLPLSFVYIYIHTDLYRFMCICRYTLENPDGAHTNAMRTLCLHVSNSLHNLGVFSAF